MSENLRFAIIGCGKIAQRHAAEAARIGNLVAVCDVVAARADHLASQYGAASFYRLEDLLSHAGPLDIISVCTPNGLHAKHSIQSLNAGIHVLCEKPMAIATADALEMIRAAEKNNRKLFVVKQNRFNPPVIFAHSLLAEKKLGRILSFQLNCFWNRPPEYYDGSWRGTRSLDGGILFTQFSHFIDLLYWFMGDIVSVNGTRTNIYHQGYIEFEDTGVACLEMADKVIGTLNYTINAYAKNMEGSFTIFAENGTLKIGGQYLNELDYFSVKNEIAPELPAGNPANQYGFYQGSMSNHDKVYAAFAKAIIDPSYPLVSAFDTMKTVDIIEKIYRASPFIQ